MRCVPLTLSAETRADMQPTAAPSCPMLECAGPCNRPSVLTARRFSSKRRIKRICSYMRRSSVTGTAFQSASVSTALVHGASGRSSTVFMNSFREFLGMELTCAAASGPQHHLGRGAAPGVEIEESLLAVEQRTLLDPGKIAERAARECGDGRAQ